MLQRSSASGKVAFLTSGANSRYKNDSFLSTCLSTDSRRTERLHPSVTFPPQSTEQRGNSKSKAKGPRQQFPIKVFLSAYGPATPLRQTLPYSTA